MKTKVASHSLAAIVGAALLILLQGCGMFATTDPWIEMGKALAGACAKCHAAGLPAATPATSKTSAIGGDGGAVLFAVPPPATCPNLEAHAKGRMRSP